MAPCFHAGHALVDPVVSSPDHQTQLLPWPLLCHLLPYSRNLVSLLVSLRLLRQNLPYIHHVQLVSLLVPSCLLPCLQLSAQWMILQNMTPDSWLVRCQDPPDDHLWIHVLDFCYRMAAFLSRVFLKLSLVSVLYFASHFALKEHCLAKLDRVNSHH